MGENNVTSRNLVKLFLTTLVIGGFTTAITGFIVRWNEFLPYFNQMRILDIAAAVLWFIVMGFLFSVVSQMGFFAYLTIHRFGLGMFKSVSLWNAVQVVLIVFILIDFVYLRFNAFAKPGESVLPYVIPAALLLIIGLIVAYYKMKQTNKGAFVPALFFMVAATIIEWVPALKVNKMGWLYLMAVALTACNAYQILILHKLNSMNSSQKSNKLAAVQKPYKTKPSKKPSV
jgi:KinB signaling pathway activation protein